MYKAQQVSILVLTKLIGLLALTAQVVLPAKLQIWYLIYLINLQRLQIPVLN